MLMRSWYDTGQDLWSLQGAKWAEAGRQDSCDKLNIIGAMMEAAKAD